MWKHFASPSKLKRHAKTHEGYVCQKGCSFVAKTWTELLKHVRETHKEEILCEVCQKTFKRKDYLKQHMKTHAPERDVCRCPREGCGRTYTTVFNLQSHILSFHEERRPFVCEHAGCGKTFAMKQSLTRHAVVHDPDKKKMKLKVKNLVKNGVWPLISVDISLPKGNKGKAYLCVKTESHPTVWKTRCSRQLQYLPSAKNCTALFQGR